MSLWLQIGNSKVTDDTNWFELEDICAFKFQLQWVHITSQKALRFSWTHGWGWQYDSFPAPCTSHRPWEGWIDFQAPMCVLERLTCPGGCWAEGYLLYLCRGSRSLLSVPSMVGRWLLLSVGTWTCCPLLWLNYPVSPKCFNVTTLFWHGYGGWCTLNAAFVLTPIPEIGLVICGQLKNLI